MRLYLDIETIPRPDTEAESKRRVEQLQAKHPTLFADAILRKANEEWRKGALSVEHSQVVCVAVAIDDEEPVSFVDMLDEADVVKGLSAFLGARLQGADDDVVLVGHNVQGFDVPVLRARAIRYRLPRFAALLARWEAHKPWLTGRWQTYDTMQRWPQLYRRWPSLDTVCDYLGITHGGWDADGDHGAQVMRWWLAGDEAKLSTACKADVVAVRAVHQRMEG